MHKIVMLFAIHTTQIIFDKVVASHLSQVHSTVYN